MEPKETWMNPQEAADYLKVKKSTIYNWTHRNFVPHHKIGKRLVFGQNELDAWIMKHKYGPDYSTPGIQIED